MLPNSALEHVDTFQIILQIIVALGLLNVWIVRRDKKTPYRGKGTGSMQSEFEAYGLPVWVMWVTGALKIGVAGALLAGIWAPMLVQPAASVLIVLMLGALAMHMKVKDPLKASIPALAMLSMAVAIVLL